MEQTLEALIFEALGKASVCWSNPPSGTFNDGKARQIGEKLLADITAYFAPKPTRVKNLSINSWCPLCKKPESWNGTLIIGSLDEEGLQDVPQTCTCRLNLSATNVMPNISF